VAYLKTLSRLWSRDSEVTQENALDPAQSRYSESCKNLKKEKVQSIQPVTRRRFKPGTTILQCLSYTILLGERDFFRYTLLICRHVFGCSNLLRPVSVRSLDFPIDLILAPRRPDRFWGPTSLLSNGYRGLFPRG
jgi:hypothetical protein